MSSRTSSVLIFASAEAPVGSQDVAVLSDRSLAVGNIRTTSFGYSGEEENSVPRSRKTHAMTAAEREGHRSVVEEVFRSLGEEGLRLDGIAFSRTPFCSLAQLTSSR